MTRYVQHRSGQGKKWKLYGENCYDHGRAWRVEAAEVNFLPVSEYQLCEPPEPTWHDVTAECTIAAHGCELCLGGSHEHIGLPPGYRFRKVALILNDPPSWAVIVERRDD